MLWEPWVYTPCEVVGGLYSVFMSSEWLNTYIVSLVNTVTLMRVPGCWRCDGNETSDSLAKKNVRSLDSLDRRHSMVLTKATSELISNSGRPTKNLIFI